MENYIMDKFVNFLDGKVSINEKNILMVIKGWSKKDIKEITLDKFLTASIDISIQKLYNLKSQLLVEAIGQYTNNISKPKIFWCTYEEYLLLDNDILSMYFDIKIIKNNLYEKQFPCIYDIEEIDIIEEFLNSDNYTSEEIEKNSNLNIFIEFYGGLNRINNNIYISYIKESDIEEENLLCQYDENIDILESDIYDTKLIELNEEEDNFLELIDLLLNNNYEEKDIKFAYISDEEYDNSIVDFNNYKSRILILKDIFKDRKSFKIYTKSTKQVSKYNENDYLDILNRFWGFNSFRQLKMYKNVNSPTNYKETIEISQSQIINDIVEQAKIALDEDFNKTFRDIFVTSPTGAGKSVMFQIPAIYLAERYEAMTIIISPLIGLMKDQVEGLHNKNVSMSATINSEITPAEKLEIIRKIKDKEISILYISPETLLSRSDIETLIGDRKIGLFVIDEAHIVTTWGKSFRADYWYLGSYLQKLRKKKDFPIATFTATAIYGGPEDMYLETKGSLNLINPITYFGYIKRENLNINIKRMIKDQTKYQEYLENKLKITALKLAKFSSKNEKTLVYFPTVGLIYKFVEYIDKIKNPILNDLKKNITIYHGQLDKLEKNEYYLKYKNNEANIMLATKAFGMGIDIPNIQNVYHFAPTGNVCDYVQEIGRAARDLDEGYAYFDYLNKDFIHVNRLHGISTLKKEQLIRMIDKILKISEEKNSRRLMISTDEFGYIFKSGNTDDVDIDNKVRTALLILQKDFWLKYQYSPIETRPRSMFTNDYFVIPHSDKRGLSNVVKRYLSENDTISNNNFKNIGDVYKCDMKGIWESSFKDMSFPQFKYKFYSDPNSLGFRNMDNIIPVSSMDIEIKEKDINKLRYILNKNIKIFEQILGQYAKDNTFFDVNEISNKFRKLSSDKKDKYYCDNIADAILTSMEFYQGINKKKSNFYKGFIKQNPLHHYKYSIYDSNYNEFFKWLFDKFNYIFKDDHYDLEVGKYRFYISKNRKTTNLEEIFVVLGILESMGLILYETNGGDTPQVYIHVNSRYQLQKVLDAPSKYKNRVLDNVHYRHSISSKMLIHLFEKEVTTEEFWDKIEDYFLGKIPEDIKNISTVI